jgi:hypothetical protein
LQAELLRQLAQRRRDQPRSVGEDDHRKRVAGARRRHGTGVSIGPGRIEPFERDVVARQEIADVVACEVEAVADDRHRGGRRFTRDFLQVADARGHRLHKLAVEIATTGDKLAEVRRFERADSRRLDGAQARDGG